jgi:hypothetical protein
MEEKLKSKYKQIAGFHFVSNVSKEGIQKLSKHLIDVTLQEKYMGEAIPVRKKQYDYVTALYK